MGDSMSTIINATTTNGVVIQPDNSGSLVLQTNSGTTALTIDTSQRAAFVAGTAALPAITTTGDTNTGIWFPAADTIAFAEGGTESMRIDSSGNVAIGATSAINSGTRVTVNGTNQIVDSFGLISVLTTDSQAANLGGQIGLGGSFSGTTQTIFGAIAGRKQSSTNAEAKGYLQFSTLENSVQERMRIDSSGNVLVNKTSQSNTGKLEIDYSRATHAGSNYNETSSASSCTHIAFQRGGTSVGSIQSANNSSTSYNTSSDYRLKENIAPMTGALATVQALKPVTYKWKIDGSNGQGFIAHELQEVVPDCVSGEKDAVETYTDEDGIEQTRPTYQGIDTSFLVATLTAAIQELKAIVDAQAIRIETLEAK